MDQISHYASKLAYEIDAADLYAAQQEGQHLVVIDARNAQAYAAEHIPGALSLPHRSMDATSTAGLDRAALYISYCDGIGCNASTKGALKLAQLGFTVKELIGGLDWWKRDGYRTVPGSGTTANSTSCACN